MDNKCTLIAYIMYPNKTESIQTHRHDARAIIDLLTHKACGVITTFRNPEETEKAQIRTEFGCPYRREVLDIAQADGKNQHIIWGKILIWEEAHIVVRFDKRRNKRLTTLETTHVSPQHPIQRETSYDTQTKYGQQMSKDEA